MEQFLAVYKPHVIVYNMFINERRDILKLERDQRVEREKEKDIERNGIYSNPKSKSMRSPPNSPKRQPYLNIGVSRRGKNHDASFEKRVIEFDKLSDMMIQVTNY